MGEFSVNGTTGEGGYFGRRTGVPGIDCNAATLTINGGTITANGGDGGHGIVCTAFTLNGGSVSANGGSDIVLDDTASGRGIISETITVNGGELRLNAERNAYTGTFTVSNDLIMLANDNRINVNNIEEDISSVFPNSIYIGSPVDVTEITLDKE